MLVSMGCAMSKPWFQSKTIWVNALTAGIATLTALQGQAIIADYPRASAAVVAGIAALNVGLRIITFLPLGG